MGLLFLDSCDHITTTAQADLKTDPATTIDGFITTAGRFGGGAYRLDGSFDVIIRTIPNHTTVVAGAAFKISGRNDSFDQFNLLLRVAESGTAHVTVGLHHGFIQVKRGTGNGTLLGTSATRPIVNSAWHYIEAKIFLSDTVGTVEVHVDGVQVLSLTSLDTINGGAGIINQVVWGKGPFTNIDAFVDDLYIDDANILGDLRIDLLMPDGDGNYTELGTTFPASPTTHWNKVEEIGPDDDTSYNNGAGVNERDTFTMEDLVAITGQTIHGVQQVTFGKHDGSATNHRSKLRISGTDYDGASQALGAAYGYLLEIWDQDPDAGPGAWTEAVINGMESGYEEL